MGLSVSAAEWTQAAASFVESLGFATAPSSEPGAGPGLRSGEAAQPWVVVRGGDDLVHLAVSRVCVDGGMARPEDYRQAQAACTQLEQQHG